MNESTQESIVSQILSDYGDAIRIRAEKPDSLPMGPSEKKNMLFQVLTRDPAIFLEKWGNFLTPSSLRHFEIHQSDYEIQFYLRKHQARLSGVKTPSKVVKNRRHVYLDKLIREGSFFSEEDMKKRDPALYEYYIGRYMTSEEKSFQEGSSESSSAPTLSQLLMKSFDRETMEKRVAEEQRIHPNRYLDEDGEEDDSEGEEDEFSGDSSDEEDAAFHRRRPAVPVPHQQPPEAPFVEEFDEEEDEEEEGAERRGNIKKYPPAESRAWGAPVEKDYWGSLQTPGSGPPLPAAPASLPAKQTGPWKPTNVGNQTPGGNQVKTKPKRKRQPQVTEDEREALRLEFLQIMKNRFLEGKEDFDYKEIDENEDYDDLKQRSRDLEDQYFNDDDDME